jgi:ribulose-5-phosphate 4-epimerase/fuculose-1-phosphate aldolase
MPPTGADVAALADAIRMLVAADQIDYSGHCSLRRDDASFYINAGSSVRASLTAADIVAIDFDGGLIQGTERPPLEYPLHAEIYRARPDVLAVVHTHPRWSTLLSMVGEPVRPVFPQGALLGDLPVLESPLSINTPEMGRRVAATLGSAPAALLKSHGAVIVGRSILEAFALAIYLEENACRQYHALQIGTPYVLSEDEQAACRARLASPALFQKAWEHYFRRSDQSRDKPSGSG